MTCLINFEMKFDKAHSLIQKSQQVLLVSHKSPDGDTLGSNLAFAHWLQTLGKSFVSFCPTPVQSFFSFVPGFDLVTSSEETTKHTPFDIVIVFDSGDLEYAGVDELLAALPARPLIINIDHHKSNTLFGDVNLVDPAASSTAEMVYRCFTSFRVKVNRSMATSLLLGIMSDTSQLTNLGTTYASVDIAGKLMNAGANVRAINHFMKKKSVITLQFWGRILSRLQKNQRLGFVSTVILLQDFEELGVSEEDCVEIANFLNSLHDTRAVLILRERDDGTVKGSLRTTDALIDVEKIAKLVGVLGGGGHKKAAGFRLPGRIKQTEFGWKII